MFEPLIWDDGVLKILDQTRLPDEVSWISCKSYLDVALCIKEMKIRGAPAIGIAGAYGVCLADDKEKAIETLKRTRPTGRDLFYTLERMKDSKNPLELAKQIHQELKEKNRKIGEYGIFLLYDGISILTHCNAGSLACCGIGTALAPIYLAHNKGMNIKVFASETRPRCQGARLTMWELERAGISSTLIADTMVGYAMKNKLVDIVFVGADRIAKNGDLANKIGTYQIAILSNYHKIPFFALAPTSTIDLSIEDGSKIPIEERSKDELGYNVNCLNPAFDITPHSLITGIITEEGITRKKEVEKGLLMPLLWG
ncbi:MAG: S-methyl-5-thioribose-1-phosphate isomerase [bacterium]